MADIHQVTIVIDDGDDANSFEESSLRKLRQRWELASVLNFVRVFEPLIGEELKMSAEEIENALINPNASLTKLHVALLKGIPPLNKKKLSEPDGWMTSLCKKLFEWWQWVAEGDIPLTVAKGEEISRYKELDPTKRLLMLKALCELRAMQDDLVSYVNNSLKDDAAQISHFRKDKIGQDRDGVSYWCDGNSVIGYRLYKEVNTGPLKQKHRGKNCLDLQNTDLEWEVLATNLDEFRKVSEKLSSCHVGVEAAVQETIETEVIPVLEKIQKKKERDLKRRQNQEALLRGSHSYATGITRSCRTRNPVKYTFDDFDRTINEAIKETGKRKGREVERNNSKYRKHGKRGGAGVGASDGDSQFDNHSEEEPLPSSSKVELNGQHREGSNNGEENDRQGKGSEDEEDDRHGKGSEIDAEDDLQSEGSDKYNDTNCADNVDKSDCETDSDNASSDVEPDYVKLDGTNCVKLSDGQKDYIDSGLRMKNQFDFTCSENLQKVRSPEAKHRYRQRPTRNNAFESSVVPDSVEESLSENLSGEASGKGEPYLVADSEDEISS